MNRMSRAEKIVVVSQQSHALNERVGTKILVRWQHLRRRDVKLDA